jgi:F0F1-type ATP synthase membrane subunit c/vacuolar-type H+-ATPase subunit K
VKSAIATNVLVGIACLAVGGAIGIVFGKAAAVPASPPDAMRAAADDGAVAAALRELSARIQQLERTIPRQQVPIERHEVPAAAGTPSPPRDDLDAVIARLTALAERLADARADASNEGLRQARIQNPQPNLAAARLLRDRLQAENDRDRRNQSARREWSLLTMAEVIARLGTPTLVFPIHEQPNDVLWEYHFDDDQMVTLQFRNGLVVDLDA